jgi:WbqC-like protein family
VRVTILQPTYWARTHVWNRIFSSDVFIWLDSVKFSRSASKWEDRTVVESPDGRPIVLRLPLRGSRNALWSEAGLNEGWRRHLETIRQCYSKGPHWKTISAMVGSVYAEDADTIDAVCWRTLNGTASILQPSCRFVRSSSLGGINSSKGDLVLDLVQAMGGTTYLTGAPSVDYLPMDRFTEAGVRLVVQEWQAPITRHGLANPSIIDLLANVGPDEAREVLSRPSGDTNEKEVGWSA